MKMVHKIILGNVLAMMFIALVYLFSHQKFDLLLDKLNYVEIADSLNATLLQMRLSEKNYFLYKDNSDLLLIRKDLIKSAVAITTAKRDIVRDIGAKNFDKLESSLKAYELEIDRLETAATYTREMEESLREAGQKLRMQSDSMLRLERDAVNRLITDARRTLAYFFGIVLVVALTSSYLFFSKMFRSLRKIEKTANTISAGRFKKIKGNLSNDELGSVMRAINSMSEELGTRHEQLIQARKLSSLGTLTAGVAHELGNPLNNISMLAQNFIELYAHLGDEDRIDYMKTVLQECERIRLIVQGLLDFSKPKKADFDLTDLNQLLRNSLKLVQNMFDISCIQSELELEEDLPLVLLDKNKIEEVIVNLLTNAVHAMSCGGTIFLRTRLCPDGDCVTLEVQDTGEGIAPEFIANVFDPFFSTKGTDGTGLGLSISYSIIKNHGGKIEVQSRLGQGTTFVIHLPLRQKEDDDEQEKDNGH